MIPKISVNRVNLFLTDKKFTWVETYWSPGVGATSPFSSTTLQGTLDEATKAFGLASYRVAMLAQGVELIEVRASDDNVVGDSLVSTKYTKWQAPGNASQFKQIYNRDYCGLLLGALGSCPPPEEPQVALRVRMQSGSDHRRIMYLSGLPEGLGYTNADYPFPELSFDATGDTQLARFASVFVASFDRWAKYLTKGGFPWGFVGTFHPPGRDRQVGSVTRADPGGPITVGTTAAHDFQQGETILLNRPQYQPGSLNVHGRFEIKSVSSPTSFTIQSPFVGPVNYAQGGKVQAIQRVFLKFTDVLPDRVAEHKRGVVEASIRGKSRSRKLFVG